MILVPEASGAQSKYEVTEEGEGDGEAGPAGYLDIVDIMSTKGNQWVSSAGLSGVLCSGSRRAGK